MPVRFEIGIDHPVFPYVEALQSMAPWQRVQIQTAACTVKGVEDSSSTKMTVDCATAGHRQLGKGLQRVQRCCSGFTVPDQDSK
jgi:hypothetical protein